MQRRSMPPPTRAAAARRERRWRFQRQRRVQPKARVAALPRLETDRDASWFVKSPRFMWDSRPRLFGRAKLDGIWPEIHNGALLRRTAEDLPWAKSQGLSPRELC